MERTYHLKLTADNESGSDLPTPASKKRKRFSLTADCLCHPRCCYIQDIIQFRLGEACPANDNRYAFYCIPCKKNVSCSYG